MVNISGRFLKRPDYHKIERLDFEDKKRPARELFKGMQLGAITGGSIGAFFGSKEHIIAGAGLGSGIGFVSGYFSGFKEREEGMKRYKRNYRF